MDQKEIKLLVAGLGKLASDLFDKPGSLELRMQVEHLKKALIKNAQPDDKSILDYTVTCVPHPTDGPGGHEIGDSISKALRSDWIPHLNDSEMNQAFVYFNKQYLEKVTHLLEEAGVKEFTFFDSVAPFYIEISNWPNAIKYWDARTAVVLA